MKKSILVFLLSFCGNVMAIPPFPPPHPQNVGQPLPYDMEVNWVILSNVKYKEGLLYECPTSMLNIVTNKEAKCGIGHEPQEALDIKVGTGVYPVGITPFVDRSGVELGVVLYYKKRK